MQKVCRQESVAVDERVVYREVIEYNTEQLDRELAQKSERRVCQRKPLLTARNGPCIYMCISAHQTHQFSTENNLIMYGER